MSKTKFILISIFALLSVNAFAAASRAASRSSSDYSSYSSSRGSSSGSMMVDLQAHYMRDTRPEFPTDTAARLSIGGMFSHWIGLDIFGFYATKSKNYLVGADIKLLPTDWFFLKAGMGAYAEKTSRQFHGTPVFGTGIQANLGDGYVLISEFNYFERAKNSKNISFGVGLGMVF